MEIQALHERHEELVAEAEAIVALAEKEKREVSEDEQSRLDTILDSDIPKNKQAIERAEKLSAEKKVRFAARMEEQIDRQQEARKKLEDNIPQDKKIVVPAKAKAHKPLQAFKGEDAERDAYVAGQTILAGIFGNQRAGEWCQNHGLSVNNAMFSGDNGKGGFIVPDEMQRTLIRLREERGVFPRFANSIPMGADIIKVPRLLADVTAYWGAENGEFTASDATLGSAELMAKKLYAMTRISTELDEDAVVEIGDLVTQSMAYAMADKIDDAGFNGDGTSTYGGVYGLKKALHSNAVQDAIAGNDSALELDLADFEATVGLYPQYPGAAPRWFMHSAVYWASAARLMDAAGGNTSVNLGDGPEMQFLGYPVTFVQVMPSTTGTLASTILAYFGDLRLGATVGTRRSMRTEVSTERYFEFDQFAIKSTERVAINVHERGDTIRTRPIVALKSAS